MKSRRRMLLTRSPLCLLSVFVFCCPFACNAGSSRESLHQNLLSGGHIPFYRNSPEAPGSVDAASFREEVLKHGQIKFRNVLIHGKVDLRSVTVDGEVDLEGCTFDEEVDFSYAVFKSAFLINQTTFRKRVTFGSATFYYPTAFVQTSFDGVGDFANLRALDAFELASSTFAADSSTAGFFYARFARSAVFTGTVFGSGAFFEMAEFDGEASFIGVRFARIADFLRIRVAGAAYFYGSMFEGNARFEDMHIFGAAVFHGPKAAGGSAVFHNTASFLWSEIEGLANFSGVAFEREADFTGLKIGGIALFNRAHFGAGVNFTSASIGADAVFYGSSFKGNTVFVRAEIKGSFLVGNSTRNADPATFDGPMDLTRVHIGGDAFFSYSVFSSVFTFDYAEVSGRTNFAYVQFSVVRPSFRGAIFRREARFDGASFSRGATFESVQFESESHFVEAKFGDYADFTGGRFTGLAYFGRERESSDPPQMASTTFQTVTFHNATFASDAYFTDSTFAKNSSFNETTFRSVYFSPNGRVGTLEQFSDDIDMRGCTYERIRADWPSLFDRPSGSSRIQPYDRQPFIQLETALRRSGADEQANAVYLERRHLEHRAFKGSVRVLDDLYWFLGNFGNDLWHECWIAVALIVLGSIILSRPGAVLPREDDFTKATKISWWEAAWLSVHAFLPLGLLVKLDRIPSNRRFFFVKPVTYVNFLHICGWILVPLAVAALTGALRHIP